MKTYIGIAAGNCFYPQHVLSAGDALQPLKGEQPFTIAETYPKPAVVKVEVDDGGHMTSSAFPAKGDAWLAVVKPAKDIEALLDVGKTDPISGSKYYPPVGTKVYLFNEIKNRLYGPVLITAYKDEKNNGVRSKHLHFAKLPTSCYREPQTATLTVANSSTQKEYHLRLARANAAANSDSELNDSERMILKLLQPMPLYMASLLFAELPLADLSCAEDDTPEAQARQALTLALHIAHIRRLLLESKDGLLSDADLAAFIGEKIESRLKPIEDFCRDFDGKPLKERREHARNLKALLNASELLHCQDESQLYEYYCLIRLIELLKTLDFKPSETLSPLRYGEYGNVKGSAGLRNTFFFQRGDNVALTLYREPRIHDDKTENGLHLYLRDSKSVSGCAPDFVLKITTQKGKKAAYVILDAKYADRETIKDFSLPGIIEKYYLRLGTERKNDTIAMVWTLQGRANATNAEPYAGASPSPMELKLERFPSFGNCVVNETDSANWDSFRNILQKLLPPGPQQAQPSLPLTPS